MCSAVESIFQLPKEGSLRHARKRKIVADPWSDIVAGVKERNRFVCFAIESYVVFIVFFSNGWIRICLASPPLLW
jgi:hypothetical protein